MPRNAGSENKVAQCTMCEFSTKLLSSFERHLNNEHNTTAQELWNTVNNGGSCMLCACGCGENVRWLNWHQGYSPTIKGHWQVGKTKDNDPRVAGRSKKIKQQFVSGERVSWARGLTRETDARIAKKAVATSDGMKKAYAAGKLVVWSKGLSKDEDERLHSTSESLRHAYKAGDRVSWSVGLTSETDERVAKLAQNIRLDVEEVRTRIEAPGAFKLLSSLENYKSTYDIVNVMCLACNDTVQLSIGKLIHGDRQSRCPTCSPGISYGQAEITDFVKQLVADIRVNDRIAIAPQELDIYVPAHKFAIEYNGLYWHCELHKDKLYHSRKTKNCSMRGIKLFHVFEDEWVNRPEIVKSMIRAKLNIDMTRLDARKCEIREVPYRERRKFFNENHVDGDADKATIAYGLYHHDELVYCLSLRRPFHKKYSNMLEIGRTCPKINTYVRGGLSRLSRCGLRFAKERNLGGLMTYVDERFGGDHAYQSAGWQFVSETKAPRFWWTDMERRYNRFMFKADAKRNMTENQVAAAAGVQRIWNCRNAIYTMS